MKKLLLLVFGLSLFIVGCADDSGSGAGTGGGGTGDGTPIAVADFDIKINEVGAASGAKVTGFSPNTTMSLKGGVFTINTTDTDILTKDITPSNMANELVKILMSHFAGIGNAGRSSDRTSDNAFYNFRKENISYFNAKIAVSDDEKSVTVDLELLPVRGYAKKVFTVTLTSSAHKFAKPTFVKASDINFIFKQKSTLGIEFTGGSDGKGSTAIAKGQLVASSTPVTTTLPKALPITYDQFWQSATAVAIYDQIGNQVVSLMHSLDGITGADDAKPVAGEHDMYGIMIFTNIVDENNNILFNDGYIFHILDLKTKLVKSTMDAVQPEPVVIKNIDLDLSAAEITAGNSENLIVITATPNVITDGVASTASVPFAKGSSTPSLYKEILEPWLAGSFLTYILASGTPLASAVDFDVTTGLNNATVVKVTSDATVLTNPTVELTIKLKAGNTFEDGKATKTITGIKTSGTIVETPAGG